MSKELEALNKIQHDFGQLKGQELVSCYETIFNALKRLEAIENSNPSEALECLEEIKSQSPVCHYDDGSKSYVFEKEFYIIKQALLKAQEQEKENELLKEIIKSLFDRGCPLHQYTNKEGVLTIEVDDECSIMRLGEFKGVDLDKYLKEALE